MKSEYTWSTYNFFENFKSDLIEHKIILFDTFMANELSNFQLFNLVQLKDKHRIGTAGLPESGGQGVMATDFVRIEKIYEAERDNLSLLPPRPLPPNFGLSATSG